MLFLLLSIALLALGPGLSYLLLEKPQILKWLNRLTFVAIAAVLAIHIIPESIEHAGWMAVVLLVVGFALPTLAEKLLHRAAERVHIATLGLGMVGLAAHGLLDGLSLTNNVFVLSHGTLPVLVLLHRIPVGQLIWALLRPSFGLPVTFAVLALVSLATMIGYYTGHHYAYLLHGVYFSLFQALVAGALLHVVLFRGHVHKHNGGEAHSHKD